MDGPTQDLTVLQEQLQALRQTIALLEASHAEESLLAALRQQALKLEQNIQTGGGAAVAGGVHTGGGTFVGRDAHFYIASSASEILKLLKPQLSPRISAEALQKATEAFFRALYDRHCYLSLRGMGVTDRLPLRLPLLELYVPLKARLSCPRVRPGNGNCAWPGGYSLMSSRLIYAWASPSRCWRSCESIAG